MPTLPERILEHLRTQGPDYSIAIAQALRARSGAVCGAIRTLRDRALVELDHEEPGLSGHPRIYYRAAGGCTEPALHTVQESNVCERLAAEVTALRTEYPGVELEALMLENRGLGAW